MINLRLKPGPVLEAIAKNSIGEKMYASHGISNWKIFLRGEKHLYCIGELDPSMN